MFASGTLNYRVGGGDRYAQTSISVEFAVPSATIRITSYNVCYTKLLRIHLLIHPVTHFPWVLGFLAVLAVASLVLLKSYNFV